SLRAEEACVDAVLDVGKRLQLDGWVLYPTREETVAAFSRHRNVLAGQFRVPTPGWQAVRWAWDKRNTYELARRLDVPIPRTWYPKNAAEVAAIDAAYPLAIKPAIKEHFIYATKAKAWKANSKPELLDLYERATRVVKPDEVMVQDYIPGDGAHQVAYCAFFKGGEAVGRMVARRLRQHPVEFGRAS